MKKIKKTSALLLMLSIAIIPGLQADTEETKKDEEIKSLKDIITILCTPYPSCRFPSSDKKDT